LRISGDELVAFEGDLARQLAALSLAHGLASVAHTDQRHRVQSREQRTVSELNLVCHSIRVDALETGVDQDLRQHAGVAEAMTHIGGGPDVPLYGRVQFAQGGKLVERPPGPDRQTATGRGTRRISRIAAALSGMNCNP
jgi:hypothetical protein